MVGYSTWHMRRFLTKIDGAYQAKHHQAYNFGSQLLRKKKHSNCGIYKQFGENAQHDRNVVINRLRVLRKAERMLLIYFVWF